MKKFLLYFCCVIFMVAISYSFAQANRVEDIVPKITGEDYEKTKLRIAQLTKQLYEGDNFHVLKDYSSRGFDCVKNERSFQFGFILGYECEIKKQYYLSDALLSKRGFINMNNNRKGASVSTKIVFYDSKLPRVYDEFFSTRLLYFEI